MILPLLLLALSPAARAESGATVAGSVVRSKEWVVRRGAKREEEFIGDVRYDAGNANLSADWALYRQEPNDWNARGNVFARRTLSSGDVVETRGHEAWYNETTLKGRLEPARGARIPLLRTPADGGEPDHAEGDHLSWEGESAGTLIGRTRGWGPRGEFWADSARYERLRADHSLTLKGSRPTTHNFLGEDDSALKADQIVLFDTPRRVSASGHVVGWVLSQSSATHVAAVDAARCGKGLAREGSGPDEKVSALLSPPQVGADGEKQFWKAEDAAFAARACPWGPRVDFWADALEDTGEPDRRVTLSGGRPVLRKLDGDSSSAIKADDIVAFEASRRVVGTGKVRGWMVFKKEEKKKKTSDKRKSKEKAK